jgi:uncharacterized membrane protein
MFTPPPLPQNWDGLHPIVVHYPIALLLTAPVLVVLALLLHKHRHALNLAALVVMAMGAAGAWLAVNTGKAAEEFVDEVGAVKTILHDHEEAAEMAFKTSLVFTVLFAVYTFVPWLKKKEPLRKWTALSGVVFLVAYAIPCLAVANAGHLGGRLVHEQGVRARLTPEAVSAQPDTGSSPEHRNEKHEDD